MNDNLRRFGPSIVLVLAGLALAACGASPHDGGAPADDRAATRAAFEQARGRWQGLGLSDYEYSFRRSCFCAPPFTDPVRITVRGGRVSQVVSAATGQVLPAEGYPSVDDLFGILQQALDTDAADIRATYDPGRAYPTSFYIDPSTQIADEELGIEARELQPSS